MNAGYYFTFRYFYHQSTVFASNSQQATALMKLMRGTTKRKAYIKHSEDSVHAKESFNVLQPLSSKKAQLGNSKVSNRRVAVLNSVFLERITDILSTSSVVDKLQPHGFFITKVKYASDGSAMHVYWNADKDLAGLESKLPMLGGLFRHELSQLHCGCVPHVNLVFDRTLMRARDVEELLNIADYGPDYDPAISQSLIDATSIKDQAPEPVVKNNIFGIQRDAILNQVMRSMRHVPAPTGSSASSAVGSVEDVQRQIDFKKYLQDQKILKDKMERKQRAADRDISVDLEELKFPPSRRRNDESEVYEWTEYIEDYVEEDFQDESKH